MIARPKPAPAMACDDAEWDAIRAQFNPSADFVNLENGYLGMQAKPAFAHLDFQLPHLGADFIAANLHKWLGAPLGLALLYVRKNRIADIAPLFAGSTVKC